jgi:hypothetical protein
MSRPASADPEKALPAADDCSRSQHTVFAPDRQTKRLKLKKLL